MFVTNWISTTKIQKISEITNFFRHYFLSRTEVNYWTPEQMHVLDVRPGITAPASIKFRTENELMEKAADSEDYYIHEMMQE